MADSIETLGTTYEVFPFLTNYRESIDDTFISNITTNKVRGGPTIVVNNVDYSPIMVRGLTTLQDDSEISSLLDFIDSKRARKTSFWYYLRTSDFKIKENISSGAASIVCYYNFYSQSYKTVDRLYFTTTSGDTYVRRVTSVIDDEYNLETTIEFTPTIVADIDVSEIAILSRVLLVRFDLDAFDMKYETNSKAEISMRFLERPTEYPAT